jgi:hypothetical protein
MNVLASFCPGTGLIVTSVMALTLVRCSCAADPGVEYDIGFLNKTGHNLDEVSAYSSNKLWALPTPLAAGGNVTEGAVTMPIPAEAEVRIIDHGKQKSVMVSINDVPKDFQDGTIYFVFNRDGTVQAKALKEDDDAGYAELIKGLRPAGEYRLGFIDKTGRDLKDISVNAGDTKLGGPNLAGGDLPARVKVAYSNSLLPPVPPEAELLWKQDSVSHAVKVKLDGIPRGFEGIIYFVLKADGTVEVHPIKNGDDKASIELEK